MQLYEIISKFNSPKPNGKNSYMVKCPCHNDNQQSLCISEKDGKILMNCFAGCRAEDITNAIGVEMKDLFVANLPCNKGTKPPSVEYMYSDTLKKIRFAKYNQVTGKWDKNFCWKHQDQNGQWQKGIGSGKVPLYKQNLLSNVPADETVYIVEGEKDTDTMVNKLGFIAVSPPNGATKGNTSGKWNSDYNRLFKDLNVAIIPDNDDIGRSYAETIANQLLPLAKSVKIVNLCDEWENINEKGDITDIYESETPTKDKTIAEIVNFKLSALTVCTKPYKPKSDMSKYIRLSDVESKQVDWLWYPYIPLGKITLMTADPGTGKTSLALYLAAQVSTGRPFYGQENYNSPSIVVYQTAEDGIEDTIKPRLEPMRPNFDNICFYDEKVKSLSLSDNEIEQIMKDLHPELMIFDPLQAYLGANVDMHRANEVRPVLGRIGHLAEKYKCAVIFIMHNSKMSQNSALHRALGSIDIPAVARSMLILGKDPENPNRKIMCHEKSSLAPHGKSILFEIDFNKGGILFCGYSDLKADDILNVRQGTRNKGSATKDGITDDLLNMFDDKDYITFSSVKELCNHLECSRGTLYNVRDDLELQYFTTGFGKDKVTYWLMPEVDIKKFRQEHTAT